MAFQNSPKSTAYSAPLSGLPPAPNSRQRTPTERKRLMSKRANSKYKLDRRVGENLWGRPKEPPVNKRSYGPGPARPASCQEAQRPMAPSCRPSKNWKELLRQHHRAAIPQILSERRAPSQRYRREYDRPVGDAPRHHRVHVPNSCRRPFAATAPAGQPWPYVQGQWPPRHHRLSTTSRTMRLIMSWRPSAREMALVMEASKSAGTRHAGLSGSQREAESAKLLRTPKLADVPFAVQMRTAS